MDASHAVGIENHFEIEIVGGRSWKAVDTGMSVHRGTRSS